MARVELRSGHSITDWVNNIAPYDSFLADKLFEDRAAGFRSLERLDLPRNKFRMFTPLATFFAPNPQVGIQGPEDYIRELNINKFFISIAPRRRDATLEKYSHHPLTPKNAIPYIKEKVSPELYSHYNLILGEFVGMNAYGGVIVVNPNGQDVRIEMVEGGSTTLTRGETPQYVITRDPFTGFFHNSSSLFEQDDARIGAYEALRSVEFARIAKILRDKTPKAFEHFYSAEDNTHIPSRDRRYFPGFYEFNLASLNDCTPLIPLFIDYKDNRTNAAYQIL